MRAHGLEHHWAGLAALGLRRPEHLGLLTAADLEQLPLTVNRFERHSFQALMAATPAPAPAAPPAPPAPAPAQAPAPTPAQVLGTAGSARPHYGAAKVESTADKRQRPKTPAPAPKLMITGAKKWAMLSYQVSQPASSHKLPRRLKSQRPALTSGWSHVLSYQWAHQEIVVRARDGLQALGIKCWMDIVKDTQMLPIKLILLISYSKSALDPRGSNLVSIDC